MKDHYLTLGISKNATAQEIKAAYWKLAIKYHPDKHNGDQYFEERFKEINEAHAILSDPYKKQNYDYYFGNKVDTSWQRASEDSTEDHQDTYSNSESAGSWQDPYSNYTSQTDYQNTYSGSQNYNPQQNLPYANVVLTLGVISIIGCLCYGFLGLVSSIVAMIIAKKESRRFAGNPDQYTTTSYITLRAGNAMAIIGLVLALIYLAIFLIAAVPTWM